MIWDKSGWKVIAIDHTHYRKKENMKTWKQICKNYFLDRKWSKRCVRKFEKMEIYDSLRKKTFFEIKVGSLMKHWSHNNRHGEPMGDFSI